MKTGRAVASLVALGLLLAVAFAFAVRVGAVSLSLRELADALRGHGDASTVAIVRRLRVPRATQAALVGAALALSGATFQALLRNPLAEPYVLGVSSGAAVGAVLAVASGLSLRAGWITPVAAFAGGVVAIVLSLRIAVGVGRVFDTRILLLAGIVVGALFNAVILLVLTLADVESFRSALFWMMGSNAGATTGSVAMLAVFVAVALVILLGLSRSLNLFAIGERTAAHLGVAVGPTKFIAYATASLLAAAAVSVSGIIGFVGLIIPHAVRLVWGTDHRFLIPASALFGAAFLVVVDALARSVASPLELPVGVITAFVGVPSFVWLLRRRPV